jgi:hypothetical protein
MMLKDIFELKLFEFWSIIDSLEIELHKTAWDFRTSTTQRHHRVRAPCRFLFMTSVRNCQHHHRRPRRRRRNLIISITLPDTMDRHKATASFDVDQRTLNSLLHLLKSLQVPLSREHHRTGISTERVSTWSRFSTCNLFTIAPKASRGDTSWIKIS